MTMIQIPMSEPTLHVQCEQFERKRILLASLIRVAQDVAGHTHSLQDALLLARPSQNFPAKVQQYKHKVDKSLLFRSEDDLIPRSKKYESQCSHLLDALLEFIELTQIQVEENTPPKEFNEDVRVQLEEFKHVTRTSIVIRLLLQDLGIILPPAKFSFPQEWLGEQIASLNDTNHHIRLKAIDKVAELIFEAQQILSNRELSDSAREGLKYVQHAMKVNLEFLEHGGNIETLPYDFESLEMKNVPPEALHEYLQQEREEELAKAAYEKSHDKQKMKFNKKLKLWLNTPWETRWRDLE